MRYIVVISFFVMVISFWNRDNLAPDIPVVPLVEKAPLQTQVALNPIAAAAGDVNYQIQPLYEYELYGLVVSYRHHDGNFGLHKLWNDHLNVADICVVFGSNATLVDLTKFDFHNGQFTCNFFTRDQQAWNQFNIYLISNNHLLTTDDAIREQIEDIKIGDQIRIKGWLSSYKNEQGGERGTSITRMDTGNGACETIYVNEVEVLQSYTSGWRKLMYLSAAVFVLSLFLYLKAPYRPRD